MFIVKCGNCTPLGERAGVSAASVRAGFSMISMNSVYEDDRWEPVRMGLAEYLKEYLDIEEQFQELAIPALKEALLVFEDKGIKPSKLPVLVGLPERRPGIPLDLENSLSKSLLEVELTKNIPFDISFIANGHTSCLTALEQAMNLLLEGEFCVVGGVDSYNDSATVDWLEHDAMRLFCLDNNEGFIPGQAAGFVLLASKAAVEKYRLKPTAKVLSVAFGEEENSFETGKSSTARALTQTLRRVIEVLPEDALIDEIYSTQNGERYHAQEYAFTIANFGPRIKEVTNMIAPYTQWGDLGAASVPVLFGLMTEAGKKGYAKGPLNLVTAANLGTQRASALVELLNLN